MAANATFAFKPGVWFRRVRFVIFAPDSRREPCRRQAENPLNRLSRFSKPALYAATGDRRQGRSLEKTIHASARNTPRARDPRQAIRTRRGRRDRLAHRLDLLRAKGLLPSMAAISADSNSLSMVISPTLDFSRAISSSRSSRSRSFRADAAPASARSRDSVSLATETFASRATTANGSPRNKIPWAWIAAGSGSRLRLL